MFIKRVSEHVFATLEFKKKPLRLVVLHRREKVSNSIAIDNGDVKYKGRR